MTTLNMRASQPELDTQPDSWQRWQPLLVVMAIGDIMCALIVQIWLAQQFIPPLTVLSIILAAAAAAVWLGRVGRWPSIGIAVVGLVYLAGSAPHSMPELAHPDGGAPFPVAIVILVAGLLALVTLIGILAGLPAVIGRRALVAGAAVSLLGVIVGVAATASSQSDGARTGDVQLTARNIAFQPKQLQVAAGGSVHVSNHDPVRHTFTIDGKISVDIAPGKARRIAVDLPTGTYAYHCSVSGHESMKGTLTVR